jgi:hypothetical protein|tara:strand:- start:1736 stop:2113 length:378 start_codon:yes stop_codon:yes gene_type:complete
VQDHPPETPSELPPLKEGDETSWDEARAAWLMGKYVLVGITYFAADGETVEHRQEFHGRVVEVDRENGLSIECAGALAGEVMHLPPDTSAFVSAQRADYKLRSTGETVTNPDALATWSVYPPSGS